MQYFLIVYNRRSGAVLQQRIFPARRRAEAMRARFKAEDKYRDDPDIEVVVLGAESAEHLRQTHARYFGAASDLVSRAANA